MKIETYIDSLVSYAMNCGLAQPEDHNYLVNRLLEILQLDAYEPSEEVQTEDLEEILAGILDFAVEKGICESDITSRDLFDTRVMGAVTPMPREVIRTFREKYARDPKEATDWYYKLSGDTDYIRRYRIAKDMRWTVESDFGTLDITINLSKPEKDPAAVAAAKKLPQTGYPKCALCGENEGYAGRLNHPARQNHRIIPMQIAGEDCYLQYSPYVYYNEHCIVLNAAHTPMVINRSAMAKLLDFTRQFPHYFIGSNGDLPIVGGSILTHEHFQGGNYTFPMEKAPIEIPVSFVGFPDVQAGIVKWPLSVLRLTAMDPERLLELADKILGCWRKHSDEAANVVAFSDGEPHNTITPIARRRGQAYELDLTLRCNITSDEHPMGVYHPHADKHHIKRENIGLIEVMGMAILPGRLKTELRDLADVLVAGKAVDGDLAKYAQWTKQLRAAYTFTEENVMDILLQETGKVFAGCLVDAGVYKCDEAGRAAFLRFVDAVNG